MKNKKYHTVGTLPNYHTVGTLQNYHTVGTLPNYHTVGTLPNFNTKAVERDKIDKSNTQIHYKACNHVFSLN